MLAILDQRDPQMAEQIYQLQQVAYTIERDLIDYPDFPPLSVTAHDIQQEEETFLSFWVDGQLAGVLSFTLSPDLLDIGRLIVHPTYFRRGVATQLLIAVERHAAAGVQLTVSTAEKNLPAVYLYQKHGYQLTQHTVLPDGLILLRFYKTTTAPCCQ